MLLRSIFSYESIIMRKIYLLCTKVPRLKITVEHYNSFSIDVTLQLRVAFKLAGKLTQNDLLHYAVRLLLIWIST